MRKVITRGTKWGGEDCIQDIAGKVRKAEATSTRKAETWLH
jgi:hypothetical protein